MVGNNHFYTYEKQNNGNTVFEIRKSPCHAGKQKVQRAQADNGKNIGNIAYYSKENLDVVKNLILPVAKIYDSSVLAILLWFIFICFLEILNIVQAGYFGLITGHMKNSNKMGWSVIFGFIGYMVLQILLIIILSSCILFVVGVILFLIKNKEKIKKYLKEII